MGAREDDADGTGRLPDQVPLFPLPGHVFLPGLPYPYRVFELRYQALVDHLLDLPADSRWLSIPLLASDSAEAADPTPAFTRIATLGRLADWTRLPNGHSLIVVHGERRVRLTEVPSGWPFRLARVEPWPDLVPPPADDELGTRFSALRQLLASLTVYLGPAGKELAGLVEGCDDPDRCTFRLAAALLPEPAATQELLETRSLASRIDVVEGILAAALAAAHEGAGGRPAFPRS